MNDTQILTIVLASVPSTLAVMIGILINNHRLGDVNARLGDVNARLGDMRAEFNTRLSELRVHMDTRFAHIDTRFDEIRATWHAELHRVEEVLDARLKHLEER